MASPASDRPLPATASPPSGQAGGLTRFVRAADGLIARIGEIVAWFNVALMGVILVQVVLRYIFNYASVALEELQWHLYAVGIMCGLSYAVTKDSHVRLDLLHANFSQRTKEWVDLLGMLILVLPWCYVVTYHGIDFVAASYRVNEGSNSPMGLPCYWIIKSVLPLSFVLFAIAAATRILRAALYLFGKDKDESHGA